LRSGHEACGALKPRPEGRSFSVTSRSSYAVHVHLEAVRVTGRLSHRPRGGPSRVAARIAAVRLGDRALSREPTADREVVGRAGRSRRLLTALPVLLDRHDRRAVQAVGAGRPLRAGRPGRTGRTGGTGRTVVALRTGRAGGTGRTGRTRVAL